MTFLLKWLERPFGGFKFFIAGLNRTQIFILVLFFASIFAYSFNLLAESDSFYHLKAGELIWENGEIYEKDIFSYTASGEKWIMHEWLAEVVFFGIWKFFGFWGLITFCAVLAVVAYSLILALALRKGANFYPAILFLFLFGYLTFELWIPRPQVFSYLFLALLIFFLEAYRERGELKFLIPIPAIFLLWANMNASFILGLGIIVFYLSAATIRKFIPAFGVPGHLSIKKISGTLIASVALSFLNPTGYHAFLYVFYVQDAVRIYKVSEWRSIMVFAEQIKTQVFLGEVFLAGIFLSWWYGFRKKSRDLILLGLVLGISLLPFISVRHAGFWPLVAIFPLILAATGALENFARKVSPKAIAAVVIVAGLSFLAGRYPYFPRDYQNPYMLPVFASDFIERSGLKGPFYNFYNEGGYLIWRFWPEEKVFMDGRSEVYPISVIREHFGIAVADSRVWNDLVYEKYKINYFMLPYRVLGKQIEPLGRTLISHNWPLVYWDDSIAIFVKDDPANEEIIEKYGLKYVSPFRDPGSIPKEDGKAAGEEIRRLMEEHPDSMAIADYANRFLLTRVRTGE